MPPPYWRQGEKRGEVLPVYTDEPQLRMIRDRSRKLFAENEFAICGGENRVSYCVGKGLTYRAAKKKPECPDVLITAVQTVLDGWAEANGVSEIEADVVKRCDRDGEAFIRFFPQSSGLLVMRQVEPEHVRSPSGSSYGAEYSFGVQTDADDVENVHGFWIVERPLQNLWPVFVPAAEVLHFKLNTERTAKRGLPTYYPVESNLRRADDLLASMTSMAKTRAKIAIIRHMKGTSGDVAQAFANTMTDATVTDPGTGDTINLEQFRYGAILNASDNIEYEFPSGDVLASDYVAVLQAELRAVAARLVMPEWMLTVDASNANMASSLVAEAPSTLMFQRL